MEDNLIKMKFNAWTRSSNTVEIVGVLVSVLNLLVFCMLHCFRNKVEVESVLVLFHNWCGPFLLGSFTAGFAIFHIFTAGEITPCLVTILLTWLILAISFLAWTLKQRKMGQRGENGESSEPLLGSIEEGMEGRERNWKSWWKHPQDVLEIVDIDKERLWRRVSFWWMNSFLALGSRKTLTIDDCPRLGPRDQGQVQFDNFLANWENYGRIYPGKKQSVVWVLWATFWPQMLINGSLALIYLICLYTGPIMLGVIVRFVGKEDRTALEGIGLVGILLVAKVISGLAEKNWYFGVERLGIWISSALVTMTYRKGLRLSNSARSSHGAGEMVNYLSVDVQRIQDFLWWMHDTWVLPLMTIIALVILFATVRRGKERREEGKERFARENSGNKGGGKNSSYALALLAQMFHVFDSLPDRFNSLVEGACLSVFERCPFRMFVLLASPTVGWGSLAGVVVLAICLSLQVPLAHQQEKVQSKVMSAKDARMKATTEFLKGMRIIKLWAWEDFFHEKLLSLRTTEFRCLCYNAAIKTINIFLIYLCPLAVALVTLGTCVLLGEPLTSAKVFTAIATFRIIQDPLFLLPLLIGQIAEASVSVARLHKLFHSEELQEDAVEKSHVSKEIIDGNDGSLLPIISIEEGTFSWIIGEKSGRKNGNSDIDDVKEKDSKLRSKNGWTDTGEKVILKGINMDVLQGARVAVCGTVGSGKSSLLLSILGEMTRLSGKVRVNGRVAYVPQSPWIQSGTIEANILFGEPMDRRRYEEAIRVCSLETDLLALPGGDQTEIGERGINVSGGQKQRIQLARAVYQNAEIYLLDDPFSAVDAHTGTEIFKECVMGALFKKTVVLVTHQVEFLPAVDSILVLKQGEIVQTGQYGELLEAGTDFGVLVEAHNQAMDTVGNAENTARPEIVDALSEVEEDDSEDISGSKTEKSLSLSKHSNSNKEVLPINVSSDENNGEDLGKLVQTEETESGQVGIQVYIAYLRGFWGGALIPFIILALLAYQVTQISGNYWLSYATTPENGVSPQTMIKIYGWLTSGGVLLVLIRTSAVNFGGVLTAQGFFIDMLRSIFWAPMSFFDTTPTGRILARASKDQSRLDLDIPQAFGGAVRNFTELMAILLVISSITPQMLFVSIPGCIAVVLLQRYYLKTSRELTRVVAISEAPILNHFSESVTGAPIIRAFGKDSEFMDIHMNLVNLKNRPTFFNAGASHWFMLCLETLAAIVFSTSALLLVLLPSSFISPALVGLSLAYGLTLTDSLCFCAMWSSQLENKIISVERIRQYTTLPQEAPSVIPENRPPSNWPHEGTVELQHLKVSYRKNAPLVLDDLNCRIQGGEKVGVVGRTGSGKSTLIQALFRLVEPANGTIVIDGIDVTRIGLKDLRTHLSIIPQEPTLFQGSVRSNMDPLNEFSDTQVWEALDRCQLGDVVRGSDGQLDASVADGGENWSVGQRQLFCLGRALLKRSQILVLDEATASVDAATDVLIQGTLAAHFSSCTVISVAHRIPTVIDSDKVIVLHKGKIAEYDSPQLLLKNKESMFSKLVAEYSKRSGSMADMASLARIRSAQNLEAKSQ